MSAPERASCCLLAACGLPGAGKSTLCAALAAHVQQGGHADCVCVSFDALEREFAAPGGAFDAERWKARVSRCAFARLRSP
jgi:adenylylsulfate kinase-like enzyme